MDELARNRAATTSVMLVSLILVLTTDGWPRTVAACALAVAAVAGLIREINARG